MAPVISALRGLTEFATYVAVTGQHREMLSEVLELFGIVPDYDLDIMQHGQSLTDITVRVLEGLTPVLAELKPHIVLVHGDTTTTFAASLAAFYHKIPVGHIEAGLRTCNKYEPFPEEVNRHLVSVLASYHFTPTPSAAMNLKREGISEGVFVTGNTVIDALQTVVRPDYKFRDAELRGLDLTGRWLLLTAHRRENWGEPMRSIFGAVQRLLELFPDIRVIFPVHKNPKIRELAEECLGCHPRVKLIEPPVYSDFANLMAKCCLVMTDSGGVQEEAPALGKPVLVLRNTTERPEGVSTGALELVGTDPERIVQRVSFLLTDAAAYRRMAEADNPYGDGKAAARIVAILRREMNRLDRSGRRSETVCDIHL